MTTAKPGRPVRGSRSGRPVMALLDLLGRRWTLRVIWELRGGPAGFRELQGLCGGLSPSVLNQRLHDLDEAGVTAPDEAGAHGLTKEGRALLKALLPLEHWAARWAKRAGS